MDNERIYKILVAIDNRLKEKNTTKNIRLFFSYLLRCMRLELRKYNDMHWIKEKATYTWKENLCKNWAMPEGENYGKKSSRKNNRMVAVTSKLFCI